jgi:hypothetical protein
MPIPFGARSELSGAGFWCWGVLACLVGAEGALFTSSLGFQVGERVLGRSVIPSGRFGAQVSPGRAA